MARWLLIAMAAPLLALFCACGWEPPESGCYSSYYEVLNSNPALQLLAHQKLLVDSVPEGVTYDNVFMGDSIIDWWPGADLSTDPTGYPWFNGAFLNSGIAGNTVCDMIRRVPKHVMRFKPKRIITDGGGNDILIGVPISTLKDNIEDYLLLLRALNPDAKIVYIGIPPSLFNDANLKKADVNAFALSMMREIHNACFVDTSVLSFGGTTTPTKLENTVDGIHWTPSAYSQIKELVEAALNNDDSSPYVFCYD